MNDTSSTSILAGLIMAPRRLLLLLIRCYQTLLSPLLGPHCRFHPSCSCYAYNSIAQYGCWKGSWLALRRIVRCTPFSDGGLDPVPQPPSSKRIKNPNGYQA